MAFKELFLDVDGMLVLSNDAQAQAWCEAFAESGYDIPFERVRPLIGKDGDQTYTRISTGFN